MTATPQEVASGPVAVNHRQKIKLRDRSYLKCLKTITQAAPAEIRRHREASMQIKIIWIRIRSDLLTA